MSLTNADVNGSGKVNARDVTLIRRWLAAIDKSTVPLGPPFYLVEQLDANPIPLDMNAEIGTFYDIPIAVSGTDTSIPKRFQVRYNPQVFAVEDLPSNGLFWHDTNKGVIRFEYKGYTTGGFAGIVNTIRFRAVGNGDPELEIGIY
jgi:hypothetical protein